jgi:hypothetical protein
MENNLIYHYCSLETFYNIVSGNGSQLQTANIRLHHSDSMDDSFDNRILDVQINQILESTGMKNKFISASNDIYFACFGRTNSNNYLWCNYADNSKGVCIGFNFPYANNNAKFKTHDSEFLYIQGIEYINEENVKSFVDGYYNKIVSLSAGNEKRIMIDENIIRFFPDWFYDLFKKNHFSKDIKYKQEDEIRLIYRTNRRKFDIHIQNERKPSELSNSKFGLKNVKGEKLLTPYFELNILDYISNITLGKNCRTNNIVIASFLEHYLKRTITVKTID